MNSVTKLHLVGYLYWIKIYIKTAPTCFGAVTPLSGTALIRAYARINAVPDNGLTAPKHVGATLM